MGTRVRVWHAGDEVWYAGRIGAYTRTRGHQVRYDAVEGEDDMVLWLAYPGRSDIDTHSKVSVQHVCY